MIASVGVGRPGAASGHGVNRIGSGFGHVVVGPGADNSLWCVPDEDGTLGACSYNELLIG